MKEIDAITLTLWGECRGEPYVGQVAVACVLRNRVTDPRWPDTYEGVALQPRQFSIWNNGGRTVRADVHTRLYAQLRAIAEGVLGGTIPDITGGANHYINAFAPPSEPSWINMKKVTLWPSPITGVHTFFKL